MASHKLSGSKNIHTNRCSDHFFLFLPGGIAGRAVLGGYGCGHGFDVALAQHYAVDQNVLRPIQDRIDQIRACIQRGDEGASLWERAKTMNVPVLRFVIQNDTNGAMVPTAVLATQPRDDPASTQTFSLLQRMRSGSDVAFQQRLLPDLIEVRRLRRRCCILYVADSHLVF